MTAAITERNILLDCTLRDGGYHNKWDFDPVLVTAYLSAVSKAGIDYVELGFRNFPQDGFVGPFGYTTESFLSSINLPEGPVYGVMLDAKTILGSPFSIADAVDILFVSAAESDLDFVRVATYFEDIGRCEEIVRYLKQKGYIVGLNLMKAGGRPSACLSDLAKTISRWESVDVLYFADSLGNMCSREVERIVDALREGWRGDIGIHAHNNMGRAVSNILTASKAGVVWLDSTIAGMGRGAGNAQTEFLLALLDTSLNKYNPGEIYELVIREFEPMKKSYGWGESILYFLGAQNNIHPTYVQNLLSNTHYGTDEIVGAISYLSNLEESQSYDGIILEGALSFINGGKGVGGSLDIEGQFFGKEVLILGAGKSLSRYKVDVERYILERKPVVFAVNMNNLISSELIDYYCISHNIKFLSENKKYGDINKPIILPSHRFSDDEMMLFNAAPRCLDYGLGVEKGHFSISDQYCILPYDLTLGYALCAAAAGGGASVSLVGVDGYERGDLRQLEMIEMLECFKSHCDLEIAAITPTTYPVDQKSVYAPFVRI